MLEQEFTYFKEHQAELVKQYNGRFIVIKGQKVIGDFPSLTEAYEYANSKYELGTFLIQHCIPGESAYKQTFHSRVVF